MPTLEIDINKIKHNAKTLKELFAKKGISVTAVIKGVTGSPEVANAILECGITTIAVSLVQNIKKMKEFGVKAKFLLTRLPNLTEVEDIVKYADISLNSEISTIKLLSEHSLKQGKRHKVVLMLELGDLREGILPEDIDSVIEQIIPLKGVELHGIGANLACFGGVKPSEENMIELSQTAERIQEKYNIKLHMISGGNSANYEWFLSTENTGKINNLRIGEAILLGRETLHRNKIPKLFTDAFTLICEVIESKIKPSLPYGEICQNAFGDTPEIADIGNINRIIIGIGEQDVDTKAITPRINAKVIGASSDHLILHSKNHIEVGSEIEFDINYSALLRLSTSPYVKKVFI
ncbi:MAG: alanine/ornithine racemase family PLP-dependent enzyme [Bacteroidetes bacterium]|nr:alanine/ornithine racemase family PLP-dependent enzyme [Bacteroidota bacterium]MBL7103143.1 alanine/ornithine racemase family PLP-dependent enzyme [Bacteroidales bacterium]